MLNYVIINVAYGWQAGWEEEPRGRLTARMIPNILPLIEMVTYIVIRYKKQYKSTTNLKQLC